MKIEKDVRIPMRDGVHLAADIYRPTADGKVPVSVSESSGVRPRSTCTSQSKPTTPT
jgi:predicted acyl esterase